MKSTPGVLVVKMNGKSQVEDFKELEVDASGNFTASLDRKDAQADKAAAVRQFWTFYNISDEFSFSAKKFGCG